MGVVGPSCTTSGHGPGDTVASGSTSREPSVSVISVHQSPESVNLFRSKTQEERNRLLWEAARHGELVRVRHLLEAGVNTDYGTSLRRMSTGLAYINWSRDTFSELDSTSLYQAAKGGHTEVVRLLCNAGASPNRGTISYDYWRVNSGMHSPLYAAVESNSVPTVNVLLGFGARVRSEFIASSPLYRAIDLGRNEILAELLRTGCMPTAEELSLALHKGIKTIVDMLFEVVAAVPIRAHDVDGALWRYALSSRTHEKYLDPLLSAVKDSTQFEHLVYDTLRLDDQDWACELLIKITEAMNHRVPSFRDICRSQFALCHAAVYGSVKVVGLLLKTDVLQDIDVLSPGRTPLMAAAQRGRIEVVRELLQRGASTNIVDELNCTALALADLAGHEAVVNLLVEWGADKKTERRQAFVRHRNDENNEVELPSGGIDISASKSTAKSSPWALINSNQSLRSAAVSAASSSSWALISSDLSAGFRSAPILPELSDDRAHIRVDPARLPEYIFPRGRGKRIGPYRYV